MDRKCESRFPHSTNIPRSRWPRGLRRGSAVARLLGLRIRIPPGAWMFVCCECCVLSGRGLCVGLITSPEESYPVLCVWVWSWILENEGALAHWGLLRHGKRNILFWFNCTTSGLLLPFALLASRFFHLFLKTAVFLAIMTASFVVFLSLSVLNISLYGLFIKKLAIWVAFVTIIIIIVLSFSQLEILLKNDRKERKSLDLYQHMRSLTVDILVPFVWKFRNFHSATWCTITVGRSAGQSPIVLILGKCVSTIVAFP
jgi:hypothetical protein